MALLLRRTSPLPGFHAGLAISLGALGLIVMLPLAALLGRGVAMGPEALIGHLAQPRVIAALWLSFRAAIGAAAVSGLLGLILAWVLVRYRFPGRRLLDAAMDLPFALPTAVAGIALTALYAPTGAFGRVLEPLGLRIAYAEAGIWLALVFVGLPFVVRSLQPVIADLDPGQEEASATLGASRLRTLRHVVLPVLTPALTTGMALALARGAGEYGSVIFIAGNLPNLTEIAPLLIVIRLEEYDYDAAAAIGLAMLAIAFVLLLAINAAQSWSRRRTGHA
ncbi:sulfate ABC transporter permease subunit CysT [Mangrovicoccus algicola]|uniref:Sulfate transport system permease protein CysT n=1 Tax=Mangrovicoccus algicola TaxID=2771008 RepID=A0A8J7CHL2_9RHOB|nr:sulfate ABC transporter permease subunit CysT [Mangrovicoccus algicola]MBE3638325.1 sulfate ABC transporter permease subunit CysT [Mangrovicoccus algicola]